MRLLDTNVILSALDPDEPHHKWAQARMGDPELAVNAVVLAELCVQGDETKLREWFGEQGIGIVSLPVEAAGPAGRAYRMHLERRRVAGAKPKESRVPLPDFLIGAHAEAVGWEVVTADSQRYRTYFPKVRTVAP